MLCLFNAKKPVDIYHTFNGSNNKTVTFMKIMLISWPTEKMIHKHATCMHVL